MQEQQAVLGSPDTSAAIGSGETQKSRMLQQLWKRAFPSSPRAVHLKPYVNTHRSLRARAALWVLAAALALFCLIYGFAFALTAPYLITQFAFPLMLLAALGIWALPDSKTNPSGLIEGFFFAFLICLILWPRYLALALPGLPWITMIRLTGFPLALIFLVSISLSKEFRERMAAILNAAPRIWKILCLFLTIQVLTIALADQPSFSLNRVINAQISWTAMFFVGCYVFSKEGRAERWAQILWALAVAVGIIGFLERPLGHVLWAGHIPSFLQVEDESVARILIGGTRMYGAGYRVQSTFTTSLALAEFIAMTLPFVMHFAVGAYRPAVRMAAVVSVPFLIFTIVLTDSRLGLLGAFAAFFSYILLRSLLEWRRRKESLVAPAVVFAFPVLLTGAIAAVFLVGRIRTRIWGGQYQASNEGRMEQIMSGLPKILKQPLGYGMNRAGETLGWVQPNGLMTIDVYWLATALDYGILGFFAFYSFFALGIYKSFNQALTSSYNDKDSQILIPLTISLLNFVLIKAVFADEGSHPIAFMMMGMAVALVYRATRPHAGEGAMPTATFRR